MVSGEKAFKKKHGVTVNFSESHDNYYTAYEYVCKSDPQVFHSLNHSNLNEIGSPKTKLCMKAYHIKRKQTSEQNTTTPPPPPKKKTKKKLMQRLSNFDVSEFMVKHKIKTETELFAESHQQKEAEKKELANFVLSRSSKSIQDLILGRCRKLL